MLWVVVDLVIAWLCELSNHVSLSLLQKAPKPTPAPTPAPTKKTKAPKTPAPTRKNKAPKGKAPKGKAPKGKAPKHKTPAPKHGHDYEHVRYTKFGGKLYEWNGREYVQWKDGQHPK